MAFGACGSCRLAKTKCDRVLPQCGFCFRHQYNCSYENNRVRRIPCTSCQKRKKRCDQQKPACGACLTRGDDCVYQDPNEKAVKLSPVHDKPLPITKFKANFTLEFLHPFSLLKNDHVPKQFYYDQKSCQMRYCGGQIVNDLSPMIFLKDLFGSLNSGDVVSFEDTSPNHKYDLNTVSKKTNCFIITQAIVFYLVGLYFQNINPLHPVLVEEEFYNIMQKRDDDYTQLLLYSVCLASCSEFPEKRLCSSMSYAFAELVHDLVRKLYSSPNLLLLQSYTILALIPMTDVNHPKAKPQRFYHSQAAILIYLLGLHVTVSDDVLPKNIQVQRNTLLCSNILGENINTSSSITPCSTKLTEQINEVAFLEFPEYIIGTKIVSERNAKKFSMLIDVPRQLIMLVFMIYLYGSIVSNHSKRYVASKNNLLSKNRIHIHKPSHQSYLDIELKLHISFLFYLGSGTTNLKAARLFQSPKDSAVVHNHLQHLCCLIDVYRPIIDIRNSRVSAEHLDFDLAGMSLSNFMSLVPEVKCLAATIIVSKYLYEFKEGFIATGFTYKWWRITNLTLFLKFILAQLDVGSSLAPPLAQALKNLRDILDLGKRRCDVAQLAYYLTDYQQDANLHKINIVSKKIT